MRSTTLSVRSSHDGRRRGTRRGFALAEVVAALGIMAVGLLALAGTTAGSLREDTVSRTSARAAARLAARLDAQVGAPCRDSAGVDSVDHIREAWRVTAADDVLTLVDTARYATPDGPASVGLEATVACVP